MKSEPLGLDINGVFSINLVFMQVRGLSIFNFELERKIKKRKTLQSAPFISFDYAFQSAWLTGSPNSLFIDAIYVREFNFLRKNWGNFFKRFRYIRTIIIKSKIVVSYVKSIDSIIGE